MVLDESNIKIDRLKKWCPPQCGWASSDHLKVWTKQKADPPTNKGPSPPALPACRPAFELEHPLSSCLPTWAEMSPLPGHQVCQPLDQSSTISPLGSQALRLRLKLHQKLFWVSSWLTADSGTQPSSSHEPLLIIHFIYIFIHTVCILVVSGLCIFFYVFSLSKRERIICGSLKEIILAKSKGS